MTISTEAEKYRNEFVHTAEKVAAHIKTTAFASDLEMIRAINKGMDELKTVRQTHVRQG